MAAQGERANPISVAVRSPLGKAALVKKLLYTLGTLTLTAIVAAGIGLAVLLYRGHALDAESKAFVDRAVPAVASTWSKQQLLDRATPELRESIKAEELTALFDALSRLGPLVQYEGATGEATMSYIIGSSSTVSASYVAKARFQNGSATFRILLLKRDGHWMIHNFHVDSAVGNQGERHTWLRSNNEREERLGLAPIQDGDPAAAVLQGMPVASENQYLSYRDSFRWGENAFVLAGCTPAGSPSGGGSAGPQL